MENRLFSITKTGAGTTTFAYDAGGQRVKTVKPDGTIIDTWVIVMEMWGIIMW